MGYVIKMLFSKFKKSQFVIFSGLFLLSSLIFIYSLETQNNYISNFNEFNILHNIEIETCDIGKFSNGSFINSRFSNFTSYVYNYCDSFGYICILNISNTDMETNISILNYNNYSYNIVFNYNGYNYTGNFTC